MLTMCSREARQAGYDLCAGHSCHPRIRVQEAGHHLPPGARTSTARRVAPTPVPACGCVHVSHTRRPLALMVFSLPGSTLQAEGQAQCQAVSLKVERRCRPKHAGEGGAQDPGW